jgi:hypothetical protein
MSWETSAGTRLLTIRLPYRKYTAIQRTMSDEEVIQAYLEGGLDGTTVGQMAGISSATVLNILKRAGHKPRPRGTRRGFRKKLKVDDQTIAQRYLAGESGPILAERLGVSQKTIYDVLEDLGVPRRHPLAELKRLNQARRQARQRQTSKIVDNGNKSTRG